MVNSNLDDLSTRSSNIRTNPLRLRGVKGSRGLSRGEYQGVPSSLYPVTVEDRGEWGRNVWRGEGGLGTGGGDVRSL